MRRRRSQTENVSKKREVAGHEGDVPAEEETPMKTSEDLQGGEEVEEVEPCCSEKSSQEKENAPGLVREDKCCVCKSTVDVKRCGKCKLTSYCSKTCQLQHLPYHAQYCSMIAELQKIEIQKLYKDFSVRQVQVDFKTKKKMLKLVGEKPMIQCFLGGKKFDLLWDTGSMVSLVDVKWMKNNFPNATIVSVSEFLEEDLRIRAANETSIQLEGVTVLEFSLGEEGESFLVPMIVTKDDMAEQILGYNVIAHLITDGSQKERSDRLKLLESALKSEKQEVSIDALATVIEQKSENPDFLTEVVSSKAVKVPAGHRIKLKCKVKAQSVAKEETVYFEPLLTSDTEELFCSETVSTLKYGRTNHVVVDVLNTTKEDKWLRKGKVLGSVHSVSAVTPMTKMMNLNNEEKDKEDEVETVEVNKVEVQEGKGSSKAEGEDGKIEWDLSHLEDERERRMMEEMLHRCEAVFSKDDLDIGDIPEFQMPIHISDQIPVTAKYRKIPPHLYNEVKNFVDDLRTNGWIRESFSAYSSPIVCVRKKGGGLRMCIDYRQLNLKTVPDSQPIPRIQDIIDSLSGSKYFTTLDMSKAYHQGYIDERFRHLTAFTTPWTLYEWIRIPFGLRNAPPAFQRFINNTLGDFKGDFAEPYLDDVLVHSRTFDQHVADIEKVLMRFIEKGVKLRAFKCHFGKQEVRYLGRLVSCEGYRADPADTVVLEKFRTPPKTIGELRSLLGFFGYFRGYVKDFSQKVKPLYDLLKGKSVQKGSKKKTKSGQSYDAREKIEWDETKQKVVEEMINYLQSDKVMAYPDFEAPFFVNCDASGYGLGAVLYQNQGGVDRVISYASRTLSDAEKNYHLHSGKLEFLALKWAVTERFTDYLKYGEPFDIYTDNNPLTYILTTAKLNATGMRWVAELSDYNFKIHYKPGPTNVDCDYLSRRPTGIEEFKKLCTESVDLKSVSAMVSGIPQETSVLAGAVSVDQLLSGEDKEVLKVSAAKLQVEQSADPVIGPVYEAVLSKSRPSRKEMSKWDRRSCILMRSYGKLRIENGGVMMRSTATGDQIVLPQQYYQMVYDELHVQMGHLGPEKVCDLAQRRFYWPKMTEDITTFIQKKCRCIIDKHPIVKERAELCPLEAKYPFEVVSIDFVELEQCNGYKYALTVVDNFTRFVQFYATRSKSSKAAADMLFNQYILQYGFPARILHDRGGEFNSRLFNELHKLAGIKASNTTPYNPQGNGACERYNKVLVGMLRSLASKEKSNWRKHLPKLAFAVNSTRNKSTGFSSFFLLFGREPVLPIDQIFLSVWGKKPEVVTHEKFAENWRDSMQQAYEIARENIGKAAGYNKRWYDRKAKTVEIKVNDLVLVKNDRERKIKKKLRSYWEEKIFRVVEIRDDIPVYKVKNIHKPTDIRVLHRNKLMCVNEIPLDVVEKTPTKTPIEKTKSKSTELVVQPSVPQSDPREVESESDSEELRDILLIGERQVPQVVTEICEGNEIESRNISDIEEIEIEEVEEIEEIHEIIEEIEEIEEIQELHAIESSGESGNNIETLEVEHENDSEDSDHVAEDLGVDVVDSTEVEVAPLQDSDTSSTDSPPVRRSARGRIPKMRTNMSQLGGNLEMEAVSLRKTK